MILVDLYQAKDRTELYYVAFTRARTLLTVFGNSVDINFTKTLNKFAYKVIHLFEF